MRHTWEDLVDVFRLAQRDLDVERDARTGKIKAARSYKAPVDAYLRKRLLQDDPTDESDDAVLVARDRWDSAVRLGELFQLGFERGNLSQWRYEAATGASRPRDLFNDHTRKFARACKAIDDPTAAAVAVRVCCFHRPAGARGEMRLLKQALDDLTRHFTGRG